MKGIRVISVCLGILVSAGLVLSGCAQPAPKPAAPAPAPAPAAAPKASPLAQIIEGAKKEGQLFATIGPEHAKPLVVERLRKELKDKYGVDIKFNVKGTSGQAGHLATAIMEHQTGAVPGDDLMGFGPMYIPDAMKSGAFEKVDWASVVEKGTVPEVIPEHPSLRGGILYTTTMYGLMYNPEKIPAAQVAKKVADLADPKWQGRLGIMNYSSHWSRWAFVLGKDKIVAQIRSIMKNKPMLGQFTDLNTRYLTGEFDLAFMNVPYVLTNRQKGMPTAWQNLDFVDVEDNHLVVRARAAHPNAAKLVAIYLAGPEGAKFSAEVAERPFRFYGGNYMYDIVEQGKKEGLLMGSLGTFPGLLDFLLSPEYDKWQKEIELILRGG